MTTPLKPWESSNTLENKGQIHRNSQIQGTSGLRTAPPSLPPRPQTMSSYGGYSSSYNSGLSPYSSMGNSYSYGSYGSMGWPGRSVYGGGYGSGYGGYGGYGNSYGMYGNGSYGGMYGMGPRDDAESRFIQYAEDSSRSTFANVESIVRAFNGIAMMLDSTFFAMTSSFRAVLGVAENFGRLRSMFGHIWQAVNIFRLFTWLHRKLCMLLGVKPPPSVNNTAWNEAVNGLGNEIAGSGGSSWPTLAFFGVLFSAPYFISKLLPKYEDKCDPDKWKANGIPAKAVFDFAGTAANELSLHMNDEILLAPKPIQEDMKLSNSGWAYATCNGRSGVVPLNYIVIVKKVPSQNYNSSHLNSPAPIKSNLISSTASSGSTTPVSVLSNSNTPRKSQKRVSFGETQIFEPDSALLFDQLQNNTSQNNSQSETERIVTQKEDTNSIQDYDDNDKFAPQPLPEVSMETICNEIICQDNVKPVESMTESVQQSN